MNRGAEHHRLSTDNVLSTSRITHGRFSGLFRSMGPALNRGDIAIAQAAATEMTEGEVRKVDKDTKKITIKHGGIKNLDMPGMTMLFQVKNAAMLDIVKPVDKVRFRAEKAGGGIVVTEIQVAK